jgi:hypothetical protein
LEDFPSCCGQPMGSLVLDAEGNIYGTADLGGGGVGSVFELQNIGGTWTQTVLYSFRGGNDGLGPEAGVTFDSKGRIYGTTVAGGEGHGCQLWCGVVYELQQSQGFWSETVLYSFQGGSDGEGPRSPVLIGPDGDLYGTTTNGGDSDCVVWSIYPGCGVIYRIRR